jgi:hypothetical protein
MTKKITDILLWCDAMADINNINNEINNLNDLYEIAVHIIKKKHKQLKKNDHLKKQVIFFNGIEFVETFPQKMCDSLNSYITDLLQYKTESESDIYVYVCNFLLTYLYLLQNYKDDEKINKQIDTFMILKENKEINKDQEVEIFKYIKKFFTLIEKYIIFVKKDEDMFSKYIDIIQELQKYTPQNKQIGLYDSLNELFYYFYTEEVYIYI